MSKTLPPEPTDDRSPSTGVVTEVAAAKGVSPLDLQPPLQDAVDPSALDALFGDRSGGSCGGRVSFRYNGFDVTVEDGGAVSVSETRDGMTSKASLDSGPSLVVERGEEYRHDEYGRVKVAGIWRGVSRVDEAHHTDVTDTIIVRYSSEQEGNRVDHTDTLDEFIEAIK